MSGLGDYPQVVVYFDLHGQKVFDPAQALRDCGWGISLENLSEAEGLVLVDRLDPDNRLIVKTITHDRLMGMYFVSFKEGGWQCLDHAITQFEKAHESV